MSTNDAADREQLLDDIERAILIARSLHLDFIAYLLQMAFYELVQIDSIDARASGQKL